MIAAFVAYRSYPGSDSIYSLLWARELLDGDVPSFDAYRAAMPYPLAVAFGVLLAPFDELGARIWIACSVLSFGVFVVGVYRLQKVIGGRFLAALAVVLTLSVPDFILYGLRGLVQAPYLAMVIWAVALEAERPRRGGPVWVLLILAGLLRPDAWVLAGVYFLVIAWKAPWKTRSDRRDVRAHRRL